MYANYTDGRVDSDEERAARKAENKARRIAAREAEAAAKQARKARKRRKLAESQMSEADADVARQFRQAARAASKYGDGRTGFEADAPQRAAAAARAAQLGGARRPRAGAVAAAAFAKWRAANTCWAPLQRHDCDYTRCDMRTLDIVVWARADAAARPHVCVAGLCDPASRPADHAARLVVLRDAYVCAASGRGHLCSRSCAAASDVVGEDGTHVCGISGMDSGARVTRSPYATPVQSENNVGDAWKWARWGASGFRGSGTDMAATVRGVLELIVRGGSQAAILAASEPKYSARNACRGGVGIRDDYRLAAIGRIGCLLSGARGAAEAERALVVAGAARDAATEYVAQCAQAAQRPDVQTLMAIQDAKINDAALMPALPPPGVLTQLICYYADRVLAMWGLIVCRTRLGAQQPACFAFPGFVVPALYALRDGFAYSADRAACCAGWLWQPDPLLASYLPRDPGSLPRQLCSSYTAMQTSIRSALTSAINCEHVSPEMLKLDSISPEDIPDSKLQPLRGCSSKKRRKPRPHGRAAGALCVSHAAIAGVHAARARLSSRASLLALQDGSAQ